MNCKECRYLLFDYIDGKLSEDTKAILDKHMEQCTDCAKRLNDMQDKQNDLTGSGLFWYLFSPSGGFKRWFFAASIMTIILFAFLTFLHFKHIIF